MAGMNDVRVLRNIIGDSYHPDDDKIPKYAPKRLGKFSLHGDSHSRNAETTPSDSPPPKGFLASMKAAFSKAPTIPERHSLAEDAPPREKPNWYWKEGQAKPQDPQSEIVDLPPSNEEETKTQVTPKYTPLPESVRTNFKNALDNTSKESYKEKRINRAYEEQKLGTDEKLSRLAQELATAGPEQQKSIREAMYGVELEGKTLKSRRDIELRKATEKLTFPQRMREFSMNAPKRIESGSTALTKGLSTYATSVSGNIGSNMGDSMIGSFQNKGANQSTRIANLQLAGYVSLLKKRHKTNDMNDLYTRMSGNEMKKLEELKRNLGNKQSALANSGFMGGQQGFSIVQRSAPNVNFNRLTQIGPRPGAQYGTFGSEAFGRLGIGQSLGAITPTNKMDALLGKGAPIGEARLSLLLGKPPQPIPGSDSTNDTRDKLKRLLSSKESKENSREKLKRFL